MRRSPFWWVFVFLGALAVGLAQPHPDATGAEKLKLESRLVELRGAPASELNGGDRPERRPYPKVQQKYQNPDRPSETWSGRGKQPRWVSDLLQSGKNIEDLLI